VEQIDIEIGDRFHVGFVTSARLEQVTQTSWKFPPNARPLVLVLRLHGKVDPSIDPCSRMGSQRIHRENQVEDFDWLIPSTVCPVRATNFGRTGQDRVPPALLIGNEKKHTT